MNNMTMIYWKGESFWLGKILEHPNIMTQGESLEELEEHLKDAYRLLNADKTLKNESIIFARKPSEFTH